MKQKKLLVVGSFISPIHELPLIEALANPRVSIHNFIFKPVSIFKLPFISSIDRILSFRLLLPAPSLILRNISLILFLLLNRFDTVFFYNCPWVYPWVYSILRNKKANIIVFCNDDPFSSAKFSFNRFIRSSYHYASLSLYYRKKNLFDITDLKVQSSLAYCPPSFGYLQFSAYKEYSSLPTRFDYDIAFIGHYEDDSRSHYFQKLVSINAKILIAGDRKWPSMLNSAATLNPNLTIKPFIDFSDYPRILSSVRFTICFFSTLNNDNLTRRCFEIPAAGSVLISSQSSELDRLLGSDNYFAFSTLNTFVDVVNSCLSLSTVDYNHIRSSSHHVAWSEHSSRSRYNFLVDKI